MSERIMVLVAGQGVQLTGNADGSANVRITNASGEPVQVTLATRQAGEDLDRDLLKTIQECEYRLVSADTVPVVNGPCVFYGFIVQASSSGVISVYDNTAASGTAIVSSLSVTAGQTFLPGVGIRLSTGLSFDLVSGTATVLLLFRQDGA